MGNVGGLRAVDRPESVGRLSVDGYGLADDLWAASRLEVVHRLRTADRLRLVGEHRAGDVFGNADRLRVANRLGAVGCPSLVDRFGFADGLRITDGLRFTDLLRNFNGFGVGGPGIVDRISAGDWLVVVDRFRIADERWLVDELRAANRLGISDL
jgi:hypothetical protein